MKNKTINIFSQYSKEKHLGRIGQINWILFVSVLALSFIGVALLFAAAKGSFYPWALKQLEIILILTPLMFGIAFVNFNMIYKYSYVLYMVGIFLLIIAEILGYKAMGAQRWIRVGAINFQPSELMKIFLIIALSRYFHDIHSQDISKLQRLIFPIFLILIPFILILKQPNLGTALIILFISGAIFFTSGVKIWKFMLVIIICLVSMPIIWNVMHDYQKQRILTFIHPQSDPLGAGYNIIQSIISIGSGGLTGKGFLQGTQSQLSFLPEKQTDFIFALLAEEYGFFGVIGVFLLSIIIICNCYLIIFNSNSQFGRSIVIGISTAFALHIFINTAMIAGLLPVVGAPFPLLSYGGSNLMAFFIGFGLVQNCKLNCQIKLKR